MELEIQRYLRAGNNLYSLRNPPYSLIIKELDDLVLLKYMQGVSDCGNPIVNECRGIILERGSWNVVCYAFNRFYNYQQTTWAATITPPFHCYEKVDGSLCRLYYWNDEWRIASSGTIDARTTKVAAGKSFFALVKKALATYNLSWEDFVATLNTARTYMYELATQDNPIVIQYNGYHLYYLGERDNATYEEFYLPDDRIDNVREYYYNSVDEVIEAANKLSPQEEGFVVRDNNWHRIKVKNPRYFELHYQENNGRPDLLNLVLFGDKEEFLGYFPQYREGVEKIEKKLQEVAKRANEEASKLEALNCPNRAAYAYEVQKLSLRYLFPYLYWLYNNRGKSFADFTYEWGLERWKRFYNSLPQ